MNGKERNLMLYGEEQALPESRTLRAGPLTVQFVGGTLRYVQYNGREIVRSVYAAVRDQNWGTVPPQFTRMVIEEGEQSFRIDFTAEHVNSDVDFIWNGRVEGEENGTIRFAMHGRARRAFMRNRIGFCVLHPITLAGVPVTIGTADGTINSRFPERISPDDPFLNMTSMEHGVEEGVKLELMFEGDLFETEDQRNWTDASYKTFCTPLALPYPVGIEMDESVIQAVTLRVSGSAAPVSSSLGERKRELRALEGSGGKLPRLGLGYSPESAVWTEKERTLLSALRLHHYFLTLKLSSPEWRNLLRIAARTAEGTNAGLMLEVLTGPDGEGLDAFVHEASAANRRIKGISVYEDLTYVTTDSLNRHLARKLSEAGLTIPIGGGTRANFAQFNRMEMPLSAMDYACYAVTPQIHAFDIASIIETLDAQPATVLTARSIVPDLPLHAGPISFIQRVNPVAANAEEAGKAENRALQHDPRLHSLFGAGWTIGCIRRMAEAGVEVVTCYENIGDLGVIAEGGDERYPVYEVFRYLADCQDAEWVPLDLSHPLQFDALALRKGAEISLLLANFTDGNLDIPIKGFAVKEGRVHNYSDVSKAHVTEALSVERLEGQDVLQLPPFAFAFVECAASHQSEQGTSH